jgi:hypothetical protein
VKQVDLVEAKGRNNLGEILRSRHIPPSSLTGSSATHQDIVAKLQDLPCLTSGLGSSVSLSRELYPGTLVGIISIIFSKKVLNMFL